MAPRKRANTVKSYTVGKQGAGKRVRSPEPTVAQTAKRAKNTSSSSATTTGTLTTGEGNSGGPPPPIFNGNFDLYSHQLDFLSKVYLPEGTTTPRYEDLYKKILTFQAKPDRTVQIYLAPNNGPSLFRGVPYDPFAEEPLDDVVLDSVEFHESLVLPKAKNSFTSSSARPGISASIELDGDHCGMQSLDGTLKMSRLWTKPTSCGNHVELFEGHITYKVAHSSLYRRKGHGSGQNDSFSFWAVRAKVGADGFEVGLKDGAKPIVVNSSVVVPPPTAAKKSTPASNLLDLRGDFKLYGMSDLVQHGLKIDPFPSYQFIHDYIMEKKPKAGMKCHFNDPRSKSDPDSKSDPEELYDSDTSELEDSQGRLQGPHVLDPFVDIPLQFEITSVKQKDSLSFTDDEVMQFIERDESLDPTGPGAIIQFKVVDFYIAPRCISVDDATGTLKLVRAWVGPKNKKGEPLEVYEAYLRWEIEADPKDARKVESQFAGVIAYWVIKADDDTEDDLDEDA